MLMLKDAVYKAIPPSHYITPSYMRRNPSTSSTQSTMPLFRVDEVFRVKILGASYVNVKDVDKVGPEPSLDQLRFFESEKKCGQVVEQPL